MQRLGPFGSLVFGHGLRLCSCLKVRVCGSGPGLVHIPILIRKVKAISIASSILQRLFVTQWKWKWQRIEFCF